jgi:hypothetical protein
LIERPFYQDFENRPEYFKTDSTDRARELFVGKFGNGRIDHCLMRQGGPGKATKNRASARDSGHPAPAPWVHFKNPHRTVQKNDRSVMVGENCARHDSLNRANRRQCLQLPGRK